MVPKESDSTYQKGDSSETACGLCPRVFYARLPWKRDGAIIQRQHFCHYGDTICHPR